MAWSFALFPWLIASCASILLIYRLKSRKSCGSRPPGPPGLPLVGNMLLLLRQAPHRLFDNLKAEYGPVIWLRLGTVNTMVVQSPEAAAELFKKCDVPFANRNVLDALTACGYNQGSLATAEYGPYLRRVRRICTVEFLMHNKVHATMEIRQKSMENLIVRIKEEVAKSKMNGGSGEIELCGLLFATMFNAIGQLILSREIMDLKIERAGEFFESVIGLFECIAKPNLADFYPFLKWLDPQGIRRNTKKHLDKLLGFASEIVRERIQQKQSGKGGGTNDFLDALLDNEGDVNDGPQKLSLKEITVVLFEMFLAGTETNSSTVEWGMTELLRNPGCMKKIQDEIDRVVGSTRLVSETDLKDLPYLQATVKETLRLYPPLPLLLPRRSTKDMEFMGYAVPENTQIMVNAWGIQRDPGSWPDPTCFKPERFLDGELDLKGQHFQMLPFGSGRRSCAGMTLGLRMVTLSIACLLQGFDWNLAGGEMPSAIDMKENLGFTLRKAVPINVIPTPRI